MPLQLSNRYRMIAGVCGGIAEWLGWDVTLVRVLYVVVSVVSVAFPRHLRLPDPVGADAARGGVDCRGENALRGTSHIRSSRVRGFFGAQVLSTRDARAFEPQFRGRCRRRSPTRMKTPTPGFATRTVEKGASGKAALLAHVTAATNAAPFGNLMQSGRCGGRLAAGGSACAPASKWPRTARARNSGVRVDRPDGKIGFFDNMMDPPSVRARSGRRSRSTRTSPTMRRLSISACCCSVTAKHSSMTCPSSPARKWRRESSRRAHSTPAD